MVAMRLRLCALLALAMPALAQPPTPAASPDGVILLHGLARSARSMDKLAGALRAAGFQVVNQDYPSREKPIGELSLVAVGAALRRPELQACPKIHFVTHSLGGILVRAYFKFHVDPRLGRVVMLGPPNQGSELVDRLGSWKLFRWLNGPAGPQLGTGADSVPRQLGPVNFELGVIAGDRSINWINSLLIPGPDDGKVAVRHTRIDGMKAWTRVHATHPWLMKNRTAIRQAIRFLRTGAFDPASAIRS
jgi:pimeloyl-ACP methyl ester carboxylesterase